MKRILSACLNQTILFSCKENRAPGMGRPLGPGGIRGLSPPARREKDPLPGIVEEAAQADGSILLKIKRQNNQYDVGTYLDD